MSANFDPLVVDDLEAALHEHDRALAHMRLRTPGWAPDESLAQLVVDVRDAIRTYRQAARDGAAP